VVDHLIRWECEAVAVACIYCNYKEQQKQTVSQLISSVLRQLVLRRSAPSDNVKKFYKEFHDDLQSSPTTTEVVKVLQAEITTYSRVYIITDALDECLEGNQRELVKTLQRLTDANLMFTSRPLALIGEIFEGKARLDISANTDDVGKYVNGRISEDNRLSRHVKKEPALRADIINKIIKNVSGMFVFLMTLYMFW
jgi:Cdc6-like AAA superfamily ATPase